MLRGRWVRSWGVGWALFAFLLQLGLSAGHLHAKDVFGPLGHAVTIGHGLVQIEVPVGPRGGDPADLDEDGCALCAVMHLVDSAVPPLPWIVLGPAAPSAPVSPGTAQIVRLRSLQPFQPRAPPAL
jgi:hypothetical protein